MYKFIAFLFIIAGILGYALFSFYGAYSDCYAANLQVRDTFIDVKAQSEDLAAISVKVGSFALKYLPNGRTFVGKMEKCENKIRLTDSVKELASACKTIHSSIKQIFSLLNVDVKARKDYHVKDAELQFKKISRNLKIDAKRYNRAAKKYNDTLKKPMPQFWGFLFDTTVAEYFK